MRIRGDLYGTAVLGPVCLTVDQVLRAGRSLVAMFTTRPERAERGVVVAATMLALDLLAPALSASAGVLAETTHADHAVEGSDGR